MLYCKGCGEKREWPWDNETPRLVGKCQLCGREKDCVDVSSDSLYGKRKWECRRCGNCCCTFYLKIDPKHVSENANLLINIHGMPKDDLGRYVIRIIHSCQHLIETNDGKACDIYETRPETCRKYKCLKGYKLQEAEQDD